jgi:hypothetical protein
MGVDHRDGFNDARDVIGQSHRAPNLEDGDAKDQSQGQPILPSEFLEEF